MLPEVAARRSMLFGRHFAHRADEAVEEGTRDDTVAIERTIEDGDLDADRSAGLDRESGHGSELVPAQAVGKAGSSNRVPSVVMSALLKDGSQRSRRGPAGC